MAKAPTKAAKGEKPAKAEKAPRVPQEKQNGVVRPSAGTATGNVWAIAEALQKKAKGKVPTRKDVLDACEADGINAATAATQFGKWCRFHDLKPTAPAKAEKPAAEKKPAAKKPEAKKPAAKKSKAKPDPVEEEEEEEEE
jgi:hypothetical protein